MLHHTFLRWLIYIVCSRLTLAHYTNRADRRFDSFSSPNQHTNSQPLYSTWTRWSPCSSSCGVGIITRTRTCLKSVYNSKGVLVSLCQGDVIEHKTCNMQACPDFSLGVREYQCAQYNNRIVAGKFVREWKPSGGGPNPCELRCEESGAEARFVYSFGKAADGSSCARGLCLDGRCMNVGCDERIGSKVELDMCGVCGGQNYDCVHYKGEFKDQAKGSDSRTYSDVIVLPTGARNVVIRQNIGKNILALRDRNGGKIFNNEQNGKLYGVDNEIAGASVDFQKSNNSTEQIIIKSAITNELYVLVLLRTYNPGIHYEYWLPKHIHNTENFFGKKVPDSAPLPLPEETHPHSSPVHQTPTLSHATIPRPASADTSEAKPFEVHGTLLFINTSPAPTLTTTESRAESHAELLADTSSTLPDDSLFSRFDMRRKRVLNTPDPLYKLRYLTKKPELDYYQAYRNSSRGNSRKHAPFFQTQGDSGNTFRRSPVLDNRLSGRDGYPEAGSRIAKRGKASFVPNERLKYSLDGRSQLTNSSVPISINVLPDSVSRRDQKDTRHRLRPTRKGPCELCRRTRNQKKHFCESDFVIRAVVANYDIIEGETRYELKIVQTFRNLLSLLPREYVWSPDTCHCPKLRPGREYIIMGYQDNGYRRRESRLLVDRDSFVRPFNPKTEKRLQRLRKTQATKCKKPS